MYDAEQNTHTAAYSIHPNQLWIPGTREAYPRVWCLTAGEPEPIAPSADDRLIKAGQTFPTPVDDRGIVLEDEVVALVKSTVRPDYSWRGEIDLHHMYWKSDWYKTPNLFTHQHARLFARFVELPVHKLWLPREFHDYLHVVTEPVEPPEPDVMHYRVMGWKIAVDLFRSSSHLTNVINLADSRLADVERNPHRIKESYDGVDYSAIEWYVCSLRRHFRGLSRHKRQLDSLPGEFRFVDPQYIDEVLDDKNPDEVDPDKVIQLHRQVRTVGSIASRHAINGNRLLRAAS